MDDEDLASGLANQRRRKEAKAEAARVKAAAVSFSTSIGRSRLLIVFKAPPKRKLPFTLDSDSDDDDSELTELDDVEMKDGDAPGTSKGGTASEGDTRPPDSAWIAESFRPYVGTGGFEGGDGSLTEERFDEVAQTLTTRQQAGLTTAINQAEADVENEESQSPDTLTLHLNAMAIAYFNRWLLIVPKKAREQLEVAIEELTFGAPDALLHTIVADSMPHIGRAWRSDQNIASSLRAYVQQLEQMTPKEWYSEELEAARQSLRTRQAKVKHMSGDGDAIERVYECSRAALRRQSAVKKKAGEAKGK
ncbi:hypothetical protein LTR27_000615 [Elasticomyces elasticus]|nr:hypothetical protein LTR27_000615 [Elasticomyces elasticus]